MSRSDPLLHSIQVASLLLWSGGLEAQARSSWSLVVDNDYFNFWESAQRRPDVEYTQGFELSVSLAVTASRLHRLLPIRVPCDGATPRCHRLRFALRQEIYNPSIDAPVLVPGQRPYAGWLAFTFGPVQELPTARQSLELEVGVTGEPSLAEFAQTRFHRLFGFREPLGWRGQLPFEPGILLKYEAAKTVVELGRQRPVAVVLTGTSRVRVGTIAVDASSGLQLGVGLWPARPGPVAVTRPAAPFSLYVTAGAHLDVVLRNAFLQGTLLQASPSVDLRHWVPGLEAGVALRHRRWQLHWRVFHRSREYRTQPRAHTYSSLGLALLP